jgi:hypothetical protein
MGARCRTLQMSRKDAGATTAPLLLMEELLTICIGKRA